jgi:4-diphosphocytidyl-2-C-methyl-D-erythritol kinase
VRRTLEASAPAKINLGLRILARRPDGYHTLDSVFAPLDLHDRLRLHVEEEAQPRVSVTLRGAHAGVPPGGEDLAGRAARAFLAESGLALAIEIEIDKRIPVAAGLGGGSSDAGTVLRLLSGAYPAAIGRERLLAVARALGADVPYFLDPRPARVGGIGDEIAPIGLGALDLLLANPGVALPTPEVYRAFDALVPAPPAHRPATDRPALRLPGGEALALDNDLEPAAVRLCPGLSRLRDRLAALKPLAFGMSGSGPTLFAVFGSAAAAADAASRAGLPAPAWARVAATRECG